MALLTDQRLRRFAAPAYTLGILLILIPLIDTGAGIFPPQPNRAFWRYGAAGVLSRGLLDPAVGVVLLAVTSVVLGHERVRKTLLVLLGVAAVVVVGGLGVFALDTLQVHASVQTNMRFSFLVASGLAFLRFLLLLLVLVLVFLSLRVPRQRRI